MVPVIPLLCFAGAAVAFGLSAVSEVRRRRTAEKLRQLERAGDALVDACELAWPHMTKMVASGGGGRRVPTGWDRDGTPLFSTEERRASLGLPSKPKGPIPEAIESEVVRGLRAQLEQLTEENDWLRSRLAERGGHRG